MTAINRAYTKNHVIPAGITFVRLLTEDGAKILGSNQQFPLTIAVEELEHFSAETGLGEVDDSAVISRALSAEIIVEDIQDDWLAAFLLGTVGSFTDAGGAVTDEAHDVLLDSEIQMGRALATPLGARQISAVTIEHSATGAAGWLTATVYAAGAYITEGLYIYQAPVGGTSSGTIPTFPSTIGATVADPGGFDWVNVGLDTLVELTDYEVDTVGGRIKILSAAGVASGESYLFDYTTAANTVPSVWTSSTDSAEYELEIKGTAIKGITQDWLFPRVKLIPSGELSLKNAEAGWQQLGFTVKILVPNGGEKAVYQNGIPVTS